MPRTSQSGKGQPSFRTTGKLTCLLLLIFLSTNCGKDSPFFYVSFDGNMRSNAGKQPHGDPAPDFRGYLKRQDLRIKPTQFWIYELQKPELDHGTVQAWIKLDSPVGAVHFLAIGGRLLLSIVDNRIHLRTERHEFEAANSVRPDGKWKLLTIIWKKENLRFYTDSNPVALSEIPASKGEKQQENQVKVGAWSEETLPPNFALRIRDLSLWNAPLKQSFISVTYQSSIQAEQKTAWRAVDLYHFCGKAIRDPSAINKIAWTTDSQFAAWRNVTVPGIAEYELIWRLKRHGKLPPDSIWSAVRSTNTTSRDLLALRNITMTDLPMDDAYQDLSMKFTAGPDVRLDCELGMKNLDANLSLDTVTIRQGEKWKLQRRGEELEHTIGGWRTDPEADRGTAWGSKNTLLYGPYACLGEPGKYRVSWRIKVSKDVSAQNEILALDVFAHDAFLRRDFRHTRTYTRTSFAVTAFRPDQWEIKSLEFKYDGADMMEFRAFSRLTKPGAIEIDTVSVEKIQ